jgi:DNA-binding XRE family transcriptional regulator
MRESLGLTQEQAGKYIGLSVFTYNRRELTRSFRIKELTGLATLFGVPIEELIRAQQGGSDDSRTTPALGATVRVVGVYKPKRGMMQAAERELVSNYAPTTEVSESAYAIEVEDDAMVDASNPRRSIFAQDWCVIEPTRAPTARDIVLAEDPMTGDEVLRQYIPLHPSNERAPGYILRAVAPGYDEIYVAGTSTEAILGVVIEKRTLLK